MSAPLESTTDVVIVGAGPAGLMAALWMARCGIKVRIIDSRATKVFRGHADGMQTGTLDMFDSFDILDDLYKTAAPAMEMTFWDGNGAEPFRRVARFPKWYPELGQYHLVHTSQGNTERALLDGMKAFNGVEVERGVMATTLHIDESSIHDPEAHSIQLTVKHLTDEELGAVSFRDVVPQPGDFNYNLADEPYRVRKISGKEGSLEVIKAKFLIGADGTRSWTRAALGFDFLPLPGDDQTDTIAGILDVRASSNFPDFHCQTWLSNNGRVAGFVPREDGIVRIACDLAKKSDATPENIIETAKTVISPWELNITHVDWCGVAGTRRRVASSTSKHSRIFLVGDALHAHSPRAGIGMNFSIQDSYNLGWKIAHVVKGIAPLHILKTYDEERGLTTKQLVAFDQALSKESPMTEEFSVTGSSKSIQENLTFSSTTAVEYEAGLLVEKECSKQHLAPEIPLGRRLPTHTVERHANGQVVEFAKAFASDGRYRIVIFAGNIADPNQMGRVQHLSQMLELPAALIQRLKGHAVAPQDVLDILVVHTASKDEVEIASLPPSLFKDSDAFQKVFVDNDESRDWIMSGAYARYGISRERGCLVLVRPDRHVMYIGDLEDAADMIKLMFAVLK